MTRRRFLTLGCLVLAGVATASVPRIDEKADPCRRSIVDPVRIVWERSPGLSYGEGKEGLGSSVLLGRHYGQVPEGPMWTGSGLKMVSDGTNAPALLLDYGRELNGGIRIGVGAFTTGMMKLRIRFGESVAEAMSELGEKGSCNAHTMRDMTVDVTPEGGSHEFGSTGFRFVRIDLLSAGEFCIESVQAVSLMRPMEPIGFFRCSDERLNDVFATAVRTVHLCCQQHIWDGIKRDRLVWMGDLHPEAMAVLAVFGKADVLSDSLDYMIATTDPEKMWMNNIATYSMWFVRIVRSWYLQTGDLAFLHRHRSYLMATLNHLVSCIGEDGMFRTTTERTLLDWPTEHNPKAKEAGVQGLLALALKDGVSLARACGDGRTEQSCLKALDAVMGNDGISVNGSKPAAALLALAGIWDAKRAYADVLGRNGHCGVSTFYGYYMLEAMSLAGENRRAIDTVRDYWGAMLDVGATSFWENFDIAWTNGCTRIDELPVPGRKDIHGDYGEFCYKGYRHSLCHGWSSGPAAWLINHVLGIRPLAPGCRRVAVRPFLGDLEWAEGAMALPTGEAVRVRVERNTTGDLDVKVDAPDWVQVER